MNKQDIIHFFDRLASGWDEDLIRSDSTIATILEGAGVKPGCHVLDVACGTGVLFPDYLSRDVASVTAMVAGGCQLVVFTTGRGSPTGNAIAPVIKITGNAHTYQNMVDNMDFDASGPVTGTCTLEQAAEGLFTEVMAVANGKMTKAETYGFTDICIDRVCRYL